jgi:hypothetical protein
MKKWMTMLAITAAAAIAPAIAQASTLRATVEHDFVVAGKLMPAGTYTLTPSTDAGTVMIRAAEGKPAAIVLTRNQNNPQPEEAHLAFREIGGKFYLVSFASLGSGYEVNGTPRTKGPSTLSLLRATVVR